MRRTLHLVSAADALALRPQFDSMLTARMLGGRRAALDGVDLDELAAAARPLFEEQPRIAAEVGRVLAERWPDMAKEDLTGALRAIVPLVQVPPRGVWGRTGPAALTTIEAWLGQPLPPAAPLDQLILRYLAAFGPAAPADIRSWSGLSGLGEAIDRLRPGLREFRDERGRALLDVADGQLPDPDEPAPPRFLPAFDNVVLAFADRSRIVDDAHRSLSVEGARFVLVDGRVTGRWTVTGRGDDAQLGVTTLRPLRRNERKAVVEEARRLATFLGCDATGVAVD
jgi:hypothetical protein